MNYFTFSPAMCKGSYFSTSLPGLIFCFVVSSCCCCFILANLVREKWYLVSHCGFDFYFSSALGRGASFHVLIGHLYIFSGEMSL